MELLDELIIIKNLYSLVDTNFKTTLKLGYWKHSVDQEYAKVNKKAEDVRYYLEEIETIDGQKFNEEYLKNKIEKENKERKEKITKWNKEAEEWNKSLIPNAEKEATEARNANFNRRRFTVCAIVSAAVILFMVLTGIVTRFPMKGIFLGINIAAFLFLFPYLLFFVPAKKAYSRTYSSYLKNNKEKEIREYKEYEYGSQECRRQYCQEFARLESIASYKKQLNELDEELVRIDEERATKFPIIDQEINLYRENVQVAKEACNSAIELSSLHKKYSSSVCVCQFIDYLETGRCYTLEGADGCYNKYEEELRQQIIVDKLDTIIGSLNRIENHMVTAVHELQMINQTATAIKDELKEVIDKISYQQNDNVIELCETISGSLKTISNNTRLIKACAGFNSASSTPAALRWKMIGDAFSYR